MVPISLSYRDPHFGLFWGLGLLLGYLSTSGANFDVIFLLSGPDLLQGNEIFAPILLSFRDLAQDRQTDGIQMTDADVSVRA